MLGFVDASLVYNSRLETTRLGSGRIDGLSILFILHVPSALCGCGVFDRFLSVF
jgi:hypothetical protein